MHSFKMKINRALLLELDIFIKGLVKLQTTDNSEKLLVATMAQVGAMIYKKTGQYEQVKARYTLTLNVAQMYAMVIISNEHVNDVKTYLGNFLNTQSLKIQQQTA